MTYLVEMTIALKVGFRGRNSFKLKVFGSLKRIVHELKIFRFLKIPSYKSNLL